MASLPSFNASTTSDEVGSALSESIAGKNVLITGTSLKSIGYETARAIAKRAALVIITGYNRERLEQSAASLRADNPSAEIRTLVLDLSSLAAVRDSAVTVNAYPEPLHVLIHNAADSSGVIRITEDGFDAQMATDYFGPFLLTKLLLPKLLASATADWVPRVVVVSSNVQEKIPGLDWATLRRPAEGSPQASDVWFRYPETKAAGALFALELARRGSGKLHAFSLHPGIIMTNAHEKDVLIPGMIRLGVLNKDGTPNPVHSWKTLAQGSATTVVASFDPRITDSSGGFLTDCVIANERRSPFCSDPENGKKLWKLTEELIGEEFEL
ncbi:hypothetical protein MKEN_00376200 [Mycena kentingensis (nom. inval.)]|nr:hypothetical protein MKEN_00376200 [Mycena kentingensis (nom. inval.)]